MPCNLLKVHLTEGLFLECNFCPINLKDGTLYTYIHIPNIYLTQRFKKGNALPTCQQLIGYLKRVKKIIAQRFFSVVKILMKLFNLLRSTERKPNFELSSLPFVISVPAHCDTGKCQHSCKETPKKLIIQGH